MNTHNEVNSEVYLLDRYIKLLIKLNPLGTGWEGTYNGKLTPTSDYWVYIILQNNKIFRGHFTLKR
ncbi:T9SS type B sorting domain-containing protein [Formosa sp. Hel1_33_131]|uniref:T9SS type B sorting domain-containing protein n=1 Tax=Formosa sp. Hel1_33_131 TaxID=1336794 RepID=UPI0009F4B6B1